MNDVAEKHKQTALSLAAQAPAPAPADQVPALVSETASLMAVIARAASDPNVDVDKMERLMAMKERADAVRARTAYYAALSEMQDELPTIQERGRIGISSSADKNPKYALWEDINKAIKPILREHGFALSFRTGQEDGKISVTGILSHREGHSEQTTMLLPADTGPGRNAVQAIGSSTSYGKRYVAIALLNITSTGEDDDGKAACGGNGCITEEQADRLFEMINKEYTDEAERTAYLPKFFKVMKAENMLTIKAADFGKAVSLINEAGIIRAQRRAAAKEQQK